MSWKILPENTLVQKHLAKELSLRPITAQLLVNRGIFDIESAQRFLSPRLADLPDPFSLIDMAPAVSRILRALRDQEQIAIYGDYDVDGITATALLARFFHSIGTSVLTYIPHRIEEGYGLSQKGIEYLKQKGAQLLITVDNGIAAKEEIAFAKTLGMEVIVTDHHTVGLLPSSAIAVVNPQRCEEGNPFRVLSGCGIAFYLACALRKRMREENLLPQDSFDVKELLDLVALGTIADVVPLTGINRILVSTGLKQFQTTKYPGIRALMDIASLEPTSLSTRSVAFALAPRLNAAGRLAHADEALALLMTQDEMKATQLAQRLDHLNRDRRGLEATMFEEALFQIQGREDGGALIVSAPHWHPGVTGIVASKLVEQFDRPAVVIGGYPICRGSVRSTKNLNIINCLTETAQMLERYGGHAVAAGLTILPEKIEAFREMFSQICKEHLANASPMFTSVDGSLSFNVLSPQLLDEIKLFSPFGAGNPEPLFCCDDIAIRNHRIVGEKHLKFEAFHEGISLDAIGFSLGKTRLHSMQNISITFCP